MSAAATWRARGALGLVALLLVGAGYPVGVTRAAPAGQVDPNVVVQITSPQPGQQLQGQVEIAGYAADQRSPSGSGLNERDIRLYLNDASDEQNLVDYAAAGLDSPSAAAALGPRFAQVGFGDTWQTCAFPGTLPADRLGLQSGRAGQPERGKRRRGRGALSAGSVPLLAPGRHYPHLAARRQGYSSPAALCGRCGWRRHALRSRRRVLRLRYSLS